jgi:hypothetical protein
MAFVAAAALSLAACDDRDTRGRALNGVAPSPLPPPRGVNVSRGAAVQPAFIDAVAVPNFLCPAVPPFLAPFTLVLDGDGRPDVFLSTVQMEFVDRTGVIGGMMTFGPKDLVSRFPYTALPATGGRAFPFSLPFGCAGHGIGTLRVTAVATDSAGQERRSTVMVPVR